MKLWTYFYFDILYLIRKEKNENMTIFEQLQNYILDQKKEIDNKDYQQGWNDCFTAISDMLTLFFKDASSDPDVINFLIDDEKAEITK